MPDAGNSFTEIELAFFRVGDEMSNEPARAPTEDDAHRPTSLWAKLVSALRRD